MQALQPKTIRIATRKSQLALWQANHVAQLLETKLGYTTELVTVVTKGDRILDIPLAEIGGKGLFLKEIEDTLIRNEADIAVHSMKDVPSAMIEELTLAAMLEREDPSDALVGASSLSQLPQGAVLGTSSLRRQSQLLALRPDLQIKMLRGNVNTRLAKLEAKEYDAIVLATAGLIRLEMNDAIGARFTPADMLPAVSQGCVGIQCRASDLELIQQLHSLEHEKTALVVTAERTCNEALGGSCHAPIGVHGVWDGDSIRLEGVVGDLKGNTCRQTSTQKVSSSENAIALGHTLASMLMNSGAKELLPETIASSWDQ